MVELKGAELASIVRCQCISIKDRVRLCIDREPVMSF